jgi:hypothetical protein
VQVTARKGTDLRVRPLQGHRVFRLVSVGGGHKKRAFAHGRRISAVPAFVSRPRKTKSANKCTCHPDRPPVKDLHLFLGPRQGRSANAGPSRESVQDDSAREGCAKRRGGARAGFKSADRFSPAKSLLPKMAGNYGFAALRYRLGPPQPPDDGARPRSRRPYSSSHPLCGGCLTCLLDFSFVSLLWLTACCSLMDHRLFGRRFHTL